LLDREEQRVVEEAQLVEEGGVLPDDSPDELDVAPLVELEEPPLALDLSLLLAAEQVAVLFGLLLALVDDAVVPAALEVEDLDDLVQGGQALDGVGHEEEVDGDDALHLDLEDAVDAGDEGGGVLLDVVVVLTQALNHDVQLLLEHGLDDELAVVREEEEAARLALRLARLEHRLVVERGGQRGLDELVVDPIQLPQLSELAEGEVGDGHLLVDNRLLIGPVCASTLLLRKEREVLLRQVVVDVLDALGEELVVLRHVPPPSVVDPDLVESHTADVLEGVDLALDLGLLLVVHLHQNLVLGVLSLHRGNPLSDIGIAREACNASEDDVDELDVEGGGEEAGEDLGLDATLRFFEYEAEPGEDGRLEEEAVVGLVGADDAHDDSGAKDQSEGDRGEKFHIALGSIEVTVPLLNGVVDFVIVAQQHHHLDRY